MSDDKALPKFKNPPVGEVSLGMRFQAPNFSPVHFGLFYKKIEKQFPKIAPLQFLPPEVVLPPDYSADQLRSLQQNELANFLGGGQTPPIRLAFKSQDEATLIQLQGDRLYFNWCSESDDYPHFEHVRNGFIETYEQFLSFSIENGFGPIKPTLSEVLYVNPLPNRSDPADLSAPEEIFRILNSSLNEDWNHPLYDIAFNARYKLNRPDGEFAGWLTANMSSGYFQNNTPKVSLQMTARGVPIGEGVEGVLAFHDIGHEAIVRNFAAITSKKMHALWGRIYE